MEKIICTICDEEIKDEEGEEIFYTRKDQPACLACYENALDYTSKAFEFTPRGVEKYIFTEDFGCVDDEGMPDPIKEERWISTDGWRGYVAWDLNPGWTEIADGWITGHPDDSTGRKVELADYFDRLESGELLPPCDLWWIFGRTSNVFSTASAIICRTEDVEKIKAWLLEIDGGLDHFQEMLS